MRCGGEEYFGNRRRDLVRTPAAFLIWGPPNVLALLAITLWPAHRVSFAVGGIMLALAALWVGVACFQNARRCARVHCVINAVLQPLLALSILLGVAGDGALKWNRWDSAFWLIILISFIPEFFGMMYLRPQHGG